jgi:hypothetical protein
MVDMSIACFPSLPLFPPLFALYVYMEVEEACLTDEDMYVFEMNFEVVEEKVDGCP